MVFSVISSSSNGLSPIYRLVLSATWIYLHVLFLCISNQCSSVEEDVVNKPFRPVPSGLISRREAIGLLLALVPTCMSISLALKASGASVGLMAASVSYSFLRLDKHWITKNVSNVAIWSPLYSGACLVLSMCSNL
jgi:4-hydroxybenzoate polyprenyltransferase